MKSIPGFQNQQQELPSNQIYAAVKIDLQKKSVEIPVHQA
jgi:hypothetical protein